MKRRLFFLALTVALLIALTTTLTVRGNTSQTWYLSSDSYSGTAANDGFGHIYNNLLSLSAPTEYGTWTFGIGDSSSVWWYTADAAQTDVSFGESDWTAKLYYYTSDAESGTLTAEIFSVQANGTITRRLAVGSSSISTAGWFSGDVTFSLSDDAGPQTIPTGDRLALRVLWDQPSPNYMRLHFARVNYPSRIDSPATDPGYPVPELPSLILVGGGLAALAAYLVLQRRKQSYAKV